MDKPITQTALARMRRAAKELARSSGLAYTAALDRSAQAEGFTNWNAARLAAQTSPVDDGPRLDLPVDPHLPPDFYNTPNEDRSAQELADWWMRPYLVSMEGRGYDVRCLDGGAWDRPTFWGDADTLDTARALAASRLEQARRRQDTPVVLLHDGAYLAVLHESRPGAPMAVLHAAATSQQIARWFEDFEQLRERDPKQAGQLIARARRRAGIVADLPVPAAASSRRELLAQAWLLSIAAAWREPSGRTTFTVPEVGSYLAGWGLTCADVAGAAEQLASVQMGQGQDEAAWNVEQVDGVVVVTVSA